MNIATKEGLFDLMEQIAEEREAARPIVERLVTSGEPIEDIEIPEGWRTAGMVLELCEKAYGLDESDPRVSLLLAELAVVLTKANAATFDTMTGAYILGRAWREVGVAHRYLCTYAASERALLEAERAFSSEPALRYAHLCTIYSRASVYFCARELEKAESLFSVVRKLFGEIDDRTRLAMCDLVAGFISFRRGDLDNSRERLEYCVRYFDETRESEILGLACNGLGIVYRMLGRKDEAVAVLERAREIAVELNHPSEINRAEWNLATIWLEDGHFAKSLERFREIRADYLRRRMTEEAAWVGLCMLDALVALQKFDEARALAMQIPSEFASSQLGEGAMAALAYLRDIVQASGILHPAVRHVRKYFERLEWEPEHVFLPTEH